MDASKPGPIKQFKARMSVQVEHPLRVISRELGHVKVRDRSLKKNTVGLMTLLELSSLWMAMRILSRVKA